MKHYRSIAAAIGVLAILLSALPSRPVQAGGGDEGSTQEAAGYHVTLRFTGHAKTGDNPVEVRIEAPGSEPASGLIVEVSAEEGAARADQSAETQTEAAVDDHVEAESEPAHDEPAVTEKPAGMPMPAGDEHAPRPPEGGMEDMGTPEPVGETDAHSESEPVATEDNHDEEAVEGDSHTEDSGVEPCKVDQPCPESDDHSEGEEADAHGEGKVLLKPAKEPGVYVGKLFLPAAGDWAIKVRFASADGSLDEHVDFTVDVIETGPNWPVLGGFFGINAAVIVTAAVLKRKSTLVIPA